MVLWYYNFICVLIHTLKQIEKSGLLVWYHLVIPLGQIPCVLPSRFLALLSCPKDKLRSEFKESLYRLALQLCGEGYNLR